MDAGCRMKAHLPDGIALDNIQNFTDRRPPELGGGEEMIS